MSTRRPLLEQVTGAPLAKSCDVPWSAMAGGDRFRRCAECDREVWNLSAMTPREAEIRLLNAAEWPCVNYRVDDERRLISRDEPRPLAPRRLGLGAAAFVATTLVAPGRGSAADKQSGKTPQVQKNPNDKAQTAKPANDKIPDDKTPSAQTQNGKTPQRWNPDDCPQPPPSAPAAPSAPGTVALNPPPRPLGGAPPPPRERPPAGTVQLKSAKPREVVIDGVGFQAPATIALPPGRHEALLRTARRRSSARST
jgi:hypothetical protein